MCLKKTTNRFQNKQVRQERIYYKKEDFFITLVKIFVEIVIYNKSSVPL